MFHLFDFGTNNKANEHESTPPHPTEEKLDEVQILEQAQSRLPAFCPHSSPFATSCSSILSGFEWYAEEPLLGIEGSEPLQAAAPPPTVDFRANTTDDRTGLDQALLSFEGSTASSEDLMHRPSAQQPENRHPINSIIAAADECSPPFVVDTLTISCPRNVTSSAPTSPLTDPPNDDDHVPSLLVTVAASPQVAPPPDDDVVATAMTIDDISTDARLAPVVEMSLDVASLPTQPSSNQQQAGNEPAGDNHSASAHIDDPAVVPSRDLDTNSDDDDDEGAEEPQLSPRLVDAGALYDAYLLRRAQLDAQGEWPTSPTTSSGRSDDDDDIDDEEDDDDGHSGRLSNNSYVGLGRLYYDDDSEDEDDYDDDEERAIYVREVLSSVGGWPQDQRALHRRNEDFPYHTYKPPAVGDSFQAVLPALLPEALRLRAPTESVSGGDQPVAAAAGDDADIVDDDGPRHEELVWSPDSVADDQVEDYLAHVRQLVDADDFSEEKALIELHRHNYDVCGALASLLVDPAPFHKDRWSEAEKVALLAGWSLYWKNWRMIQTMVPSRSTGEIMQFYYQNKPRADHLRRQRAEHDDNDDSEEEEQQQEEQEEEEEDDAELEAVTTLAGAATRSPSSSSSASSPHQPLPTSPHERSDLAPSPVHSQLRGEAADDMDAAASSDDDDDNDGDDGGREAEDGDVDGDDGDSSCREDGKEEGFGGQEIQNGARRGGNNKRKRVDHDQQQRDDDNDAATVDEALPGDGEGHDRSEEDEERASSSKRARLERDEAAARLRVPQLEDSP